MRFTIILIAAMLAGGCSAIKPAAMRMPSGLDVASERHPFNGIGGGTKGNFTVGAYRGEFERSEKRLAIFDVFERNYGHAEYLIKGPAISSTIEADCRFAERLIDLEIAEFKPKKMAYRCEYTAEGRPFAARFELQEVGRELAGALSKNERRGEIALGGETVQIRSVHKLVGTPIAMANPIGYVFEQEGRPVGAVELNGSPVMFVSDGADEGLARTIAVASVALAVFWDPANSALDDD